MKGKSSLRPKCLNLGTKTALKLRPIGYAGDRETFSWYSDNIVLYMLSNFRLVEASRLLHSRLNKPAMSFGSILGGNAGLRSRTNRKYGEDGLALLTDASVVVNLHKRCDDWAASTVLENHAQRDECIEKLVDSRLTNLCEPKAQEADE